MRPYSYSRLKTYLTCPRQFEAKYVTRSLPYTASPAMERGKRVHETLEQALLEQQEPSDVWTPQELFSLLVKAGARPEVEHAMAIDGTPCGWEDARCLLRGKIDVEMPHLMLDWKTGQIRPDPLQADVYAALKRAEEGHDYAVDFYFVYVDQKHVHKETPDAHALDRVLSIIDTIESDTRFNPHPCFACKWCQVEGCEYRR